MARNLIINVSNEVIAQTEAIRNEPNIIQLKEFYLGPMETGPTIGGEKITTVAELANHPAMKEFDQA